MGAEKYSFLRYVNDMTAIGPYITGLVVGKIRETSELIRLSSDRRDFQARVEYDINAVTQDLSLEARQQMISTSWPHHFE